jgi:hypothetical protein
MAATNPGTLFTEVWLLPMNSMVMSAEAPATGAGVCIVVMFADPPPPPQATRSRGRKIEKIERRFIVRLKRIAQRCRTVTIVTMIIATDCDKATGE